jgi:adenylate kinase family enzyme
MPSSQRIHIFGASGSGTSTLGRVLADKLSVHHFDADDYYWKQTEQPYTVKRRPEERVLMLLADMDKAQSWVLSGSVVSWGDSLYSAVLFSGFRDASSRD